MRKAKMSTKGKPPQGVPAIKALLERLEISYHTVMFLNKHASQLVPDRRLGPKRNIEDIARSCAFGMLLQMRRPVLFRQAGHLQVLGLCWSSSPFCDDEACPFSD